MKKALILGLAVVVLCSLFIPGIAGADNQWQTVTLGEISFQLPGDWLMDEEEMGFGEQEMAWYAGELEEPVHYMVLAYGPEFATYLDFFIMDEAEYAEILSDETIQMLGREGRKVILHNIDDEAYGVFIAVEEVTSAGEDLLLIVGTLDDFYEGFMPQFDLILASFPLDN